MMAWGYPSKFLRFKFLFFTWKTLICQLLLLRCCAMSTYLSKEWVSIIYWWPVYTHRNQYFNL